MIACQKEEYIPLVEPDVATAVSISNKQDGRIQLGEQLENPYSVANMQKAYESLESSDKLKSSILASIVIVPSHLYFRFLPTDTVELNILQNDSSLELFDYPLDYEITEDGSYYQDPNITEDNITWQYTTVPVDYQFPNIKYEVIYNCFIPDEDENKKSITEEKSNYLALLEY